MAWLDAAAGRASMTRRAIRLESHASDRSATSATREPTTRPTRRRPQLLYPPTPASAVSCVALTFRVIPPLPAAVEDRTPLCLVSSHGRPTVSLRASRYDSIAAPSFPGSARPT